MSVVGLQALDCDRGSENRPERGHQRGESSAGMWRGKEQHGTASGKDVLPPCFHGITRRSENLLGDQAAQAVAYEKERTFTETALHHQIEHLQRAIRKRHSVSGV